MRLFINDIEVPDDKSYSLRQYGIKDSQFILNIKNEDLSYSILQVEIGEFSEQIKELHPIEHCDGIRIKDSMCSLKVVFQEDGDRYLVMTADLEMGGWKKAWSPEEFNEEMYLLSEHLSGEAFIEEPVVLYGVEFAFLLEDASTIEQELEKRQPEIIKVWEMAEKNLQNRLSENSIVSQFNFPSEIRSSCEEYLLSFIQFLKDVGVEAVGDLKHEGQAGQVLFSVTPTHPATSGKGSLEKIRQSLDLYLRLAGATNFEFETGTSIQVDRLESRLLFFQSQLKLAQAEAKAQLAEVQRHDKTIEAQEATILTQRVTMASISASNVFLESQVEKLEEEAADKDQLEFFDGLVTFSNPEIFGFSINLARVFVILKALMAEDEPLSEPDDSPALPAASEE